MSDLQSFVSSVTPSESASGIALKKKGRAPKHIRNANRVAVTTPATSVTGSSSFQNAQSFAVASTFAPTPQPGKFPVVFQTGAGEPSTDESFAYDPTTILNTSSDLSGRYVYSSRYAEFSSHAGITDEVFSKDVSVSFLLGLAQQTVHAHSNMGLPIGDFSSISTTDVYRFSGINSIITQFGEHSVPALGKRFLLNDYDTTVSSLVYAADKISTVPKDAKYALENLWLPMHKGDARTKLVVAVKLSEYFKRVHSLSLDPIAFQNDLFSGVENSYFNVMKTLLPNGLRSSFDFMFKEYDNSADWVAAFTPEGAQKAINRIGLSWFKPDTADLNFNYLAKVRFPALADEWLRKRSTVMKFFSCASGLAQKSSALGSTAQLSVVESLPGVTLVRAQLSLSAPEFSLQACFPSSGLFPSQQERGVVVSTSIPLDARRTEFLQLDWL